MLSRALRIELDQAKGGDGKESDDIERESDGVSGEKDKEEEEK